MNKKLKKIVNPVIRDEVIFINTAAETNGAFTEVEVTLMPGGGTPLHFHRVLTETFIVLSGTLSVRLGRNELSLTVGESVMVTPGAVHRFFNKGTVPVVFRTIITPGSEGFEQSLHILYGLAGDGLTNRKAVPKSLKHLAVIAHISDMHTPGLLSLMTPVFRRIAAKAKQNGGMQALIDRYCK